MPDINFTTGPATLPDIGELSYNGCTFSPLFESTVSGNAIKDKANRTVKNVEYTITVDGYVTMPDGGRSVNGVMLTLRELLQAQAGELIYKGRGLDIVINAPGGGGQRDVTWGPIPEVLDFQPLGAGKSAKIKWQVKVSLTEYKGAHLTPGKNGQGVKPLQFNFETSAGYGEDGYSTLSIKGTLEIPITRISQGTRSVPFTVDNLRNELGVRIMRGIDLSKYHITSRNFNISRDKRTLEWSWTAEEQPYMKMPPDCTIARGTYSVKPAIVGMGLALWLCTLRATYTVRGDKNVPRETAWVAFLSLLKLRMEQSERGNVPDMNNGKNNNLLMQGFKFVARPSNLIPGVLPVRVGIGVFKAIFPPDQKVVERVGRRGFNCFLIDFSFDEGLYLDSKTASFSATWRIVTGFENILLASGIWTKLPEVDAAGNNLWAISMKDVSGEQSWLPNLLDPNQDIIIDFGGGKL